MPKGRKSRIDNAVERAVTGRKPKHERAGMSREEFDRGINQRKEELRRERMRNGQSTDNSQ